ncbi:hypothetical protein [Psychromonas sp.]|uniref:hypothetical protein n=1 Tax=Psychromonas sp. TaxID=1884585 RepID=UPI003563544C
MNEQVKKLVQQIRGLEDELSVILKKQEKEIRYRVNGTRIEFEKKFKEAQKKLKVGIFRWLRTSKLNNLLSAPFIYAMIVPIVILDICITLYQFVCFRLYHIPRVSRSDYMIFDRHHLAYLNVIEKINCSYCAYGVGLIAYSREIIARTEQYWCPIKHANKLLHPNKRDLFFMPYGKGEGLHSKQELYRRALSDEEIPVTDIEENGKDSEQFKSTPSDKQ